VTFKSATSEDDIFDGSKSSVTRMDVTETESSARGSGWQGVEGVGGWEGGSGWGIRRVQRGLGDISFASAMSVYQEVSDRYFQRVSKTDPVVSKTGGDSHVLSWGSPEMV